MRKVQWMSKGLGIPEALYIGFVGFAAAFLGILFAHYGAFRCPYCRVNLGIFIMQHMKWLSMDSRVRFCPYCGAAFDAEFVPPEFEQPAELA